MRITPCLLAVTALFMVLVSCESAKVPPPPPPEPPFELTQVMPNPPKVEKVEVVEKPKKVIIGRIMEITEDQGVQKFVFIKFPAGTKVVGGQEGTISSDPTLAQKIGTYKIIEIYPDLCRAQITDLSFKIGKTAMATFETTD